MDINNALFGAGAIGILVSCWNYVKSFTWRFVNIFIEEISIEDDTLTDALVSHLVANYQKSKFYDKLFGFGFVPIKKIRRDRYISAEMYGRSMMIFWNGWLPIVYLPKKKASKSTKSTKSNDTETTNQGVDSCIMFLRGTVDVDSLIIKSCDQKNELLDNQQDKDLSRFYISRIPEDVNQGSSISKSYSNEWREKRIRLLDHTVNDFGFNYNHSNQRPIDRLFFPKKVENLINEIRKWKESKEWYEHKGIAWKKGILLYGPPGTGKTALVRAFAEELNMPIVIFNLARLSDADLQKYWLDLKKMSPCIALFEDFDNVFHGRDNVVKSNESMAFMSAMRNNEPKSQDNGKFQPFTPVNFDTFLNCLDGVEVNDGIFVIITTNDVSKIDPALGKPSGEEEFISTRPGRIDRAIELTYMTKENKKKMAIRMLSEFPNKHKEIIDRVDNQDTQESPAQFQELCSQIALKEYWKQQEDGVSISV